MINITRIEQDHVMINTTKLSHVIRVTKMAVPQGQHVHEEKTDESTHY